MSDTLADDLLRGAGQIANHVYKKKDHKHKRKVYHAFETERWPIWKDGAELVSRKSLLDQHFQPPTKIAAE